MDEVKKDKENLGFSDTVFSDGRPIAVSTSPYEDIIKKLPHKEKFAHQDLPLVRTSSGTLVDFENKKLRLECIKLAITACAHQLDDDQLVIDTMKRFWHFTRTGD